ncbi:MAG: hypothetical protein DRN14_06160 [Thermoplasmata archaeon]|nr:MAG: hypothetical protein DRN14_06160 [Thermoplasmata archaeon]
MPKGILLSLPARMRKVTIAFSKGERDQIISILQDLGTVHLERVEEKGEVLEEIRRRLREIEALKSRLSIVPRILGGPVVLEVNTKVSSFELEKLARRGEETLKSLLFEAEKVTSRIEELESEISRISEVLEALRAVLEAQGDASLEVVEYSGKHVFSALLRGPCMATLPEGLEEVFRIELGEDCLVGVVGLSEVRESALRQAEQEGFSRVSLPELPPEARTISDAVRFLEAALEERRSTLARLEKDLRSTLGDRIREVAAYLVVLEAEEERLRALEALGEGKYLEVVEGYVPVDSAMDLRARILDETTTAAIVLEEPSGKPPTKMENYRGINWYEPLVRFYGIPDYDEWDPTPLIAYSFALFFGLMLADLGYAIGLLLAVKLVLHKFVEDPESEFFKLFRKMMYANAFSSLVFGALTATAFGFSLPYKPLLSFPLEPTAFIKVSLIIGLIHIIVAHTIAAARALREGSRSTFLNEIGIIVVGVDVLYLFLLSYRVHKSVVDLLLGNYMDFHSPHFMLLVAMFALVVVGKVGQMGGLGVLLSLFDFTGILGDVLSYARIAGVGMATLFLAGGFNLMIGMLAGAIHSALGGILGLALGAVAAFPLYVFAHLINLGLSALGAGVHSLRLCFVEFLTKFYEGSGREFRPFRIPLRRTLRLLP